MDAKRNYIEFKMNTLQEQRKQFILKVNSLRDNVNFHVEKMLHLGNEWLSASGGGKHITFNEISQQLEDSVMYVTTKVSEVSDDGSQSSSSTEEMFNETKSESIKEGSVLELHMEEIKNAVTLLTLKVDAMERYFQQHGRKNHPAGIEDDQQLQEDVSSTVSGKQEQATIKESVSSFVEPELRKAVDKFYTELDKKHNNKPDVTTDYSNFELFSGRLRLRDFPNSDLTSKRDDTALALSTVEQNTNRNAVREKLGFRFYKKKI